MDCLANPTCSDVTLPALALREPSRWYALYTYPRHEKAVREQLRSRCVEVFLPTFTRVSQWRDRKVKINDPVFPGYVFTRIQLSERSRVLCVPGVVRMLSYNGAPAPIDDSELEAVKLCLERGVAIEVQPFLEVGERVRVRSGVLMGVEGLISHSAKNRTLIVPISLINQSVAVEVDASLLELLVTTGQADS